MSRAARQSKWRAGTRKHRVEVYLDPDVVAALDAMPGSRAEVIANLVAPKSGGCANLVAQRSTGRRSPAHSTAQLIADTRVPRRTILLADGTAVTTTATKTASGNFRYTFMVNGRRISRANLERKLAIHSTTAVAAP